MDTKLILKNKIGKTDEANNMSGIKQIVADDLLFDLNYILKDYYNASLFLKDDCLKIEFCNSQIFRIEVVAE